MRAASRQLDTAPRIFALERAVEVEDADELLAPVSRLADEESEVDEREDDVADVGGGADAPVVQHQARHDAVAFEREIAARHRELAAGDVAALGGPRPAEREGPGH